MSVMAELGHVFGEVCLPIVVLIGIGWGFSRRFDLDLDSLIKLNLYLFVPAFILVHVVESELGGGLGLRVVLFTLAVIGSMAVVSGGLSFLLGMKRESRTTLMLSTMFYNSGNFGIPLMLLAYPTTGPVVQVFVLMTMNVATFTIGLMLASVGVSGGGRGTFRRFLPVLRQPTIYAIAVGLFIKAVDFHPQEIRFVWVPLSYLSDAFIGFALVALGVQLSKTKPARNGKTLGLALVLRLAVGPLCAIALTALFGFRGELAAILILGAAAPTAVNTALLAHEFKADSRSAAAAVFLSTLLSVVVVAVLLSVLRAGGIAWAKP